jgi:E3 ubiquitin-protein ligase BAH
MSEAMAKAVCAQVTEEIIGITPQIDDGDYTCPICSTISWRPIRLSCQHVLCSKCAVHLQSTFKYNCPICRAKQVVKDANEDNIDEELIKKLKKYFPKETREKKIQLETEDGIATFGPTYKHPSEDKCEIM